MTELLASNTFFCVFLTIASFEVGRILQKKWKIAILNPILIGAILTGTVLLITGMSVEVYQAGCKPLQYWLTPATICLAISLYEQIGALKKHLWSIVAGVLCGTFSSLLCVRCMARILGLDQVLTTSLLPKSITTAIGAVLSQEAGGIASMTTAAIILTGILGNMFGPLLCKLFQIQDPIAKGTAFGTAAHVIGTSKASELSELFSVK